MEYSEEPRLVFSPLSEKDYCQFYALEMDSFLDDLPFYLKLLNRQDHVLELGCGTGRLTRHFARNCRKVTAIDYSAEMLRHATASPVDNIVFEQMDMLELSFANFFNIIVIPYNTLNLLGNCQKITKCLRLCRKFLPKEGQITFQVYLPGQDLTTADPENKQFQFKLFSDNNGGKIIKETLKSYSPFNSILHLEERFRVRPARGYGENQDLSQSIELCTPAFDQWQEMIEESGFMVRRTIGDYDGSPFRPDTDSTLFLRAEAV